MDWKRSRNLFLNKRKRAHDAVFGCCESVPHSQTSHSKSTVSAQEVTPRMLSCEGKIIELVSNIKQSIATRCDANDKAFTDVKSIMYRKESSDLQKVLTELLQSEMRYIEILHAMSIMKRKLEISAKDIVRIKVSISNPNWPV